MTDYRAAWVPDDDPQRPWDDAAELAVVWLRAQAADLELSELLITPTFDNVSPGSPLTRYQRGRNWFTRLSDRPHGPGHAVLAYVPDAEDLELATSLARRGALAVVESVSTPLRGWAAGVEAIDLLTGAPTDPNPPALDEHLERLKLYSNNGFGSADDKHMARRVLDDLRREGLLQRDVVLGALAARGVSARGQKNLAALIDKTSTGR